MSSIRLLSAWDEEHIWRWNRKPLKTVTSCVHHLIEERTRKCPDAHAVCAWDGTLTYAALDDLSSSLGSYLKTLGIGPETFVPLCVEKSKWAVVATLAVLKAGGACVHLSASYPIDRVTDILHMVEAKVLIVSPEFATQFKSKVDHVVCVTQSLLEKVLPTARRSCKDVQPKNAAFVVFTSGSTGQPKGVIKDHLSISSSAHAHASAFLVSSKSRVLQFAAYVWAISIYDMVSTLIQGGCVVIPSETARMNSLAWTIRELQVNHATLSPSIVKLIRPADVPMLQTLVLGGEEISKSVIDDWSDHVQIFNNYGSSETLCSLTCSLKRGDNGTTLGYATTANRCWIVDTNHHDRLVSIGGIGELLVEGHIIARSYLHDQKNTDRAFITNPAWQYDFLTRAGQLRRYYKTGDLVRYDLNGKIVFIGRKDSQVKLRGQRIELAEVEYHLQRYLPDAGEAVAGIVTILGVKERKALAAFVCPPSEWQAISSKNGSTSTWKDQVTLLIKGLEAKLSSSLPAHMIPSVYFPITKLPRTASGKLNRKLLAQMAEKLPAEQRLAYTESANKLETMSSEAGILLQHWRQVLPYDLAIAYADDNFFHMGGNSIDAIELVNSLHKDGWNLTVGDIFRYPTLNAMSRMLMVDQHPNEEAPVPFSLIPRSEIESLCTEAADQCNIAQEMVEDIYPCTPLQEGLMALSMRQPGAYVAQHVFALPKDWDLVAFKEAWNRVVSENSILRTRLIRTESHGWLQVVVNENVEWTVGGSMEDYRSSALNKIMDFGGPLMRCGTVSATGSDAAQFVWTIHHSIYDGWSVPLILKSVQEVYQHKHTTKAGDFNRFIQYILNIDRELSETYWRSQLADWGGLVFPRLPSTAYQPRPNSIERLEIHMPKNRTGLTTSTIIRAAWSLLLARHTNERDVVFGATVAGRSVPVQGIKDLIGPTISTVPVRIQLDYEKTVEAFLQDIQNHSTEMMAHEQFGLQNINRIGPDAANACQFQNLLIVQPMLEQIGESELKQIAIHSTDYLTFALTLECSLVKDGISIEATFDDIVLDCKQMKRLLLQFEQVLFQIQSSVQDGRKLRDITILSSADREEILAWNSHLPIVVDSCLHVLIQGRAESHHSATALCSWDGEMSYGELNVLSTRLGHELATRGVGPEVFVPLCFEKSSWTVIAILAVMKAGGAFVLLDPSHPVERLGSIVHSVGASLIVASPQQLQLCLGLAENIVPLDRAYVEQLTVNNQEVASHVKSHNALYVTFTSGSTGKPKGAVIEHRSCVSGFQAQAAAGFFDENSRVLQFASYSFDSSIEQILATLLVGGTICIPSDSERTSDLAGVMNRLAVNLADLTPSVAGLLEPAEVPDLRILRLSGESIPSTLIQKWAGRVRLENSYGPSECSVTSVANCQVLLDTDRTNIGRSIGCLTWIVESDESMKLAPIGTVGELVIQGPIIGRGYLNDLQETAAAFMEHVTWLGCTAEFPSRLYRTGDLARYDSKGDILFVGRKDTQIKLRGQRIELSEIECLLVTQAAIEACVAVVPRSGPYCDRIIATVKLPNPAGNTGSLNHYGIRLIATDRLSFVDAEIARLQLHLEKVLPTYMIPSAWAVVEQLPLLTSGKLDRKAIGLWLSNMYEVERYAMRTVSSDAQNLMPIPPNEPLALELSTKIALLVAKYDAQLGTKVRGQDVALQNAGLDSISIIALLKDINKTYSVSLDLAVLLRGITIRELARHIEGKRNGVASNFSREADSAMSNFIQEVNRLRSQFLDSATCQGHLTSSTQRGPQTIFLTGATGYLGTQILRDSLNRPGIRKVIAHVRAKTPEEGIQKLKRSAMAAEWWSEKYAARLEIWIGDLGKPFLGLTTRQWQRLSGAALPDDCINFIIHNGAVVNWYSNYASLRNANVLSVAYLLQAVKMSGFATRLVYISGGPQWDPDSEDDSDEWFNAQLASSNGYGQSKLVAERLVSSSLRTLTTTFENRISIIKPGFVIGTRTEGVANVDDFIWRIVAGSISIQAYSEETKASWIFVTSSDDFSSQILGYLDQDQGNPRAVQKLRGGLTVRDFWGVIEMKYGLELQPLKHDEWLMRLKLDVDEKGDTHPCGPIMHMAEQGPEILGTQAPANLVDTSPKAELLMAVERNIQYLLDIGFLPSKHQMQRQTRQEVIFRRSGRVSEKLLFCQDVVLFAHNSDFWRRCYRCHQVSNTLKAMKAVIRPWRIVVVSFAYQKLSKLRLKLPSQYLETFDGAMALTIPNQPKGIYEATWRKVYADMRRSRARQFIPCCKGVEILLRLSLRNQIDC